ncbi:MAG TPA: DNA ligase [Povalibacter sp.]|uniref:DNA ligase n=1 Tax=Povalibacter sp. TaxID=1962978 RepID=UPI002C1ABC18|nr:DNA ligase [Povalibacter sp.]HMN44215.1 DNA ligase [Povalibacter sp.]
MERRHFLGSLLLLGTDAFASTAAPVLLANPFRDDISVADYWISEKFDGVRALWNGRELLSRSGNVIAAPVWFLDGLPDMALDGELWIDRGEFEAVVATVRDAVPVDAAWRRIRFMIFDLPQHPGPFDRRLSELQRLAALPSWLQPVRQFKVRDREELFAALDALIAQGGEGLMLHHGAAPYRAGRSDDLLKLKRQQDAEAQVIAHLPGKGKYANLLGALRVRRADGLEFNVGSGLSDAQRHAPPPIGSWITYGFQGETANGVPRFARFLRMASAAAD